MVVLSVKHNKHLTGLLSQAVLYVMYGTLFFSTPIHGPHGLDLAHRSSGKNMVYNLQYGPQNSVRKSSIVTHNIIHISVIFCTIAKEALWFLQLLFFCFQSDTKIIIITVSDYCCYYNSCSLPDNF